MFLGIDLGTTGIKAVLLSSDGKIAASVGMEYESIYPKPGWVEQNPQVWLDIAVQVVKSLWIEKPELANRVQAVSFSGQMHGAVFVDKKGNYLRPAIIWSDGRSKVQVDRLLNDFGSQEIARMTGNPIFPGFMLPSILWVRENEPEIWKNCCKVLLPKDYLRFIFTGTYYSEPSDASSTGICDIKNRCWNHELLDLLSIDENLFPQIIESSEIAGVLNKEMAEKLGLSTGTLVICGGSDQACQALGNGIIHSGKVSGTIGTGGQIFAPIAAPIIDPLQRLHLFCHVVPDTWHYEAATLSAGLSLRWLREIIGNITYQQMADYAEKVSPGSENLFFAPFLQGERTPYMDSQVRGGCIGLSIQHGLPHLVRSVMEGVLFSMRTGYDLICEKAGPFEQMIASGGAIRHPLWLNMMADIFNLPIMNVDYPEQAAVGAAMLAGIGVGVYRNVQEASRMVVRYSSAIFPKLENVKKYHEIYNKYRDLYPLLAPFTYRQET